MELEVVVGSLEDLLPAPEGDPLEAASMLVKEAYTLGDQMLGMQALVALMVVRGEAGLMLVPEEAGWVLFQEVDTLDDWKLEIQSMLVKNIG